MQKLGRLTILSFEVPALPLNQISRTMKQRVTFLVKPDSPPTDPEQFKLSLEALQVKGLHAARQERWTINANELPTQVSNNRLPVS